MPQKSHSLSPSRFLPEIKTTGTLPYKLVYKSTTNSHFRKSEPATLTRSLSLSEYWTHLKSAYLIPKHLTSLNSSSHHLQSTGGDHSHSAPVISKTFEESLLPTHNIFFAGRPRTPKVKAKVLESSTKLPSSSTIIRRGKRTRSRNSRRRVTFLDATV